MSERNASQGYIAIKVQSDKHVAVTPDVFVPYYSQSLATDPKFISDEPVFGSKFKRFQVLQGLRSHGGSFSVMAEPNSIARFLDMLATKTSSSGTSPTTHTFEQSTTDPKFYTIDISFVSQVVRFFGFGASKLTFGFDGDKMVLSGDGAALHSFYGREVSAVTGSGPYTITLKTNYDPAPTDGLVVGDLIQIYDVSAGTYISCTVASIVNDTQITTSTNVTAAADGDVLTLRPATSPSLDVLTPFLWPRTEFRFGADASVALSAAHTALEPGSQISIMHEFDSNDGAKRSGSFDPASLPRKQYDLEVQIKKYLDEPTEFNSWNTLTKRALVMRSFSEDDNELRVTLNNLKATTDPVATQSNSGPIIHELAMLPSQDTTDGQAFDVKVLNQLSSI